MGIVDSTTVLSSSGPLQATPAIEESSSKPLLSSLISVHDFEDIARKSYTPKAFAFYSSAATDLVSYDANRQCHRRLLLRPRVLRNVKDVSIKRRILGHDSRAPFFVSPTAMARLAHPDGELAVAAGCSSQGIIHIVSISFLSTHVALANLYRSHLMHRTRFQTSLRQANRVKHSFSSCT